MTDKKSRRVVIINNIKSDTIDQAIFILKSKVHEHPERITGTVAQEAQEIINSYIRQVELIKSGSYSKRKRAPKILPVALFALSALCVGLSFVLFYCLA